MICYILMLTKITDYLSVRLTGDPSLSLLRKSSQKLITLKIQLSYLNFLELLAGHLNPADANFPLITSLNSVPLRFDMISTSILFNLTP